ncbi:DUF1499 domain-containing protein [Chelativorans sp. AA-79]|uniref:DUF1499 domain-containing protein n=1 Tax=Chelativorans sp. AA-79 TaxID=3028735 RepID=UPI0023FA14AF|nr:DUF1499 domain-containing protein [Chelativorans sp. AA-79]WEX07802.1 DUF1499 domain-containing protein [Chelativorans sp. AA-79]
MPAVLERRVSSAAPWSRRFGAFAVALFLTSAISHRFRLIDTVPFLWLLGLCFLLAVLGLSTAILAFAQMWRRGVGGLGTATLGALLSLVALGPYAVSAYGFSVNPPLNDVSTDPARPPPLGFATALRVPPMTPVTPPTAEGVILQAEAYPDLSGRLYEQAREIVVERVIALMRDRGWQVVAPVRPDDATDTVVIEAVARSYLLGFPSDVAVRIEDRGEATYVDMRSASRYGRHDLGENAVRIRRFLSDLDESVQTRPLL